MKDDRYPNPYTHPHLLNTLRRPPRTLQSLNPEVRAGLTHPSLLAVVRAGLQANNPDAIELLTDLRQFERALNADRARPGEYLGRTDLPTEPMPFQNREQHHPSRLPGSPQYEVTRKAVENFAAAEMQEALQARMAEPTTWERTAPASSSSQEPSLRESIEASASLFPKE